MSIHIQAWYRDGLIHPAQPLDLPNDTAIEVDVIFANDHCDADSRTSRMTPAEWRELVTRYAISAPSLAIDFSRGDIYQNHD